MLTAFHGRMTAAAISRAVVVHLLPVAARAQTGSPPEEWRFYGGDSGHTNYSPLDQISRDNVDQLRIAWTWTSVDETLRAENPVIRDGRVAGRDPVAGAGHWGPR